MIDRLIVVVVVIVGPTGMGIHSDQSSHPSW